MDENQVFVGDLDKADVLRVLYNNAKVQGMGIFQAVDGDMSKEEAQSLLARQSYFDYLKGRVMKVEITETTENLDVWLYDRDNGPGAAKRAIETLR